MSTKLNHELLRFILCIYTAYTGHFCEEDVDGCTEISCFAGVSCTDNAAPMTEATCGPCPPGLEGDGMKCVGKVSTMSFGMLA